MNAARPRLVRGDVALELEAAEIAADPSNCSIKGEGEAERRLDIIRAGIADPDCLFVGGAEVHAAFGPSGLRSYFRCLQKRLERAA